MNPITVLLADDHRMVREGMRALLNMEDDVKVVGEAENGHQAVAFASKLCPDVVLMDISMPLLDGLDATREILLSTPSTKVIMLSAYDDKAYIKEAMAAGAAGYLIKEAAARVLPQAIRAAHEGKPFLTPERFQHLE